MSVDEAMAEDRTRPQAREVSCLALGLFLDYVEEAGVPRSEILSGLPYPPEHFLDRLNWIDYPTFLEIEHRIAERFQHDPEVFYKIGYSAASRHSLRFVRTIARSVLSPYLIYQQLTRLVPRFMFPFVRIEFEKRSPTLLRARYRFTSGYRPSRAFLDTVRGILATVPTTVGAEPARVEVVEQAEDGATFEIAVSASRNPLRWVRGLFARLAALFEVRRTSLELATHELEEANTLLLEKVDDLIAAKTDLDRRVRDLELLRELSANATMQLDSRRLVRSAVRVVSRHRDGAPCLLELIESDQGGPVVAASAGISLQQRRAVERELAHAPPRPLPQAERARSETVTLAGITFARVHLGVGSRVLGRLYVGHPPDDPPSEALLASVGQQLAVAIENARSYRLVQDLRDNLEVRVEERTAQLEEARNRLEDTVRQLESASQAQQRFFTNVSHELKTPLTLVIAPLDELETEVARTGSERALAMLGSLRRNARHLHELVEELLDFSRLDAGGIEAHKQPLDLVALAADVVDTLRPLAQRRRIDMRLEEPDEPCGVFADPRHLRKVLFNLVGNAIKYIREGDSIRVRLRREGAQVRVDVADTGPGIPEDQAELVFERFHRCWNDEDRVVEGSGIGLAMARELVDLHGGTLVHEPTPGGGSTFVMRLPVGLAGAAEPEAGLGREDPSAAERNLVVLAREPAEDEDTLDEPTADPDARLVLVVEDNVDMRLFLERTLQPHFRVRTAANGEEGLAAAREWMPDLVLSDVAMPRLDGLEMCRRLKADTRTRNIPVILVSARPGKAAALEGFAAGADDYVVKPFSSPELVARVSAQIRIRALTLALIRAEKQATLGLMAAGIAHEVLNPVNVVINATGLLRHLVSSRLGEDADSAAQMIDLVEEAGKRIQRVVEGVLTLSRRNDGELKRTMVDLPRRVDAVLRLLDARARRAGVTIRTELEGVEPFPGFADLLDQAITNLVANAIDALEDHGGGTVRIRAERFPEAVRITVADDGPGVPPALRERIFAPFYTTKEPGRGTGLGLAMTAEIAELHGGRVELLPSERGAVFRITVPLVDAARDGEPAA